MVVCPVTGIVAKVNNEAEHRAFVRAGIIPIFVVFGLFIAGVICYAPWELLN